MSQKFDKLKTLLKELFQLDQPDLDFGLYRIMHAKSGEVTQFLDKDLLPQVREAFSEYRTADKAELEKELSKAIAQAQGLGVDPESTEKVQDLRRKIADEAVDIDGIENEVYDHLYSFFRRYYQEGDFLAKRVYKPGVYAIPYEGEEVKLHWANRDQYYIKSSEYLRDYTFQLKPHDEKDPMRVHFKLVDAAEGEHGNNKPSGGNGDRVFILAGDDFIAEEDGELVIRFEYRPAAMDDWSDPAKKGATAAAAKKPPAQAALITDAARRIVEMDDQTLQPWIAELTKPHTKADGEHPDYSRLEGHLNRYTARNTFDYFIHKNLGGFLRRELDFYIKNEVMHLDDVESESAPRVEQYLSKIKVIRKIAGKIIDFLDQLEGFQKRLWLKKKFVVETNYCITLDRIPEEFYPEIATNEAQREEWVRLFAIDELTEEHLGEPSYSNPLTVEFLTSNPGLTLDTKHFDTSFTSRIIDVMGSETPLDGLVIHSDNYHALNLLHGSFRGAVDCIYIDPPYNTGKDEFMYKDNYKSSSWLSAIEDRSILASELLSDEGVFLSSIADHELDRYRLLLQATFGQDNFLANFIWNNEGNIDNQSKVKVNHEYILAYCKNERMYAHPQVIAPHIDKTSKLYNDTIENSITKNGPGNPPSEVSLPSGFPATFEEGTLPERSEDWPQLRDKVIVAEQKMQYPARAYSGWSSRHLLDQFIDNDCNSILDAKGLQTWFKITHTGAVYCYKERDRQSHVVSIIRGVGTVKRMSSQLGEMGFTFSYPKPVKLIEYLAQLTNREGSIILDYYAGSGTSAHAAINLEREQSKKRRYVLVDDGDYFDSLIVPRIRRVVYCADWKDKKPVERNASISHYMKYIRLETYEDALNNITTQRTETQQQLLQSTAAQGENGLTEQYMLRYMLDVETRGSQSLLNIDAFTDPTAYKLKVKRPGSEESRETNVDLLETFNFLVGLTVQHIAAPQTFSADTERDDEGRLRLKGRLKPDAPGSDGPWWFRTVEGTTPDGRRTLVIWRKLPKTIELGPEAGAEQDNLILDEWFKKQGYSTKDHEFNLFYVNGDNNLENLRQPDDTWKVRLIEEDFHRLMFDTEGV